MATTSSPTLAAPPAPPAAAPVAGASPGRGAAPWAGPAVWVGLVAAALLWGHAAVAESGVSLRAAPFAGRWAWEPRPGLVPAALVGAAAVALGPRIAARAPWRAVPATAGVAAVVWTVALAAADGWSRLTEPLTTRHEYEPFAAGIDDLGGFLAGYTDGLARHPIHVQGHPPGPVVVAWALDRVGLGGAGWLAVLALLGWGVAVAAALVAARAVAGEAAARRAAPALVVLPAAVWAGTSLDALFAGVIATGCALAVVALSRSSPARAATAGIVLGGALLCTYGTLVSLAIPVAAAAAPMAVARRRPGSAAPGVRDRPHAGTPGSPPAVAACVVCGAAGVAALLGLAAAAGFSWVEGLDATRRAYWSGIGARRPGWYLTLAGNPGALALAAGPAVAAGLAPVLGRARTVWRPALLPGAALAAVLVADLSQMARGEVERIWLPFVPWLALAAPGHRRSWLAAQVVVGLTLQTALSSPW